MFYIKKVKGKKGFTLMEMLIVVAIIVVLVAISVPVFANQVEEAKEAVDTANLRSARALAIVKYYSEGDSSVDGKFYDADNETFTASKPVSYAQGRENRGKVIQIDVSDVEGVTASWVE